MSTTNPCINNCSTNRVLFEGCAFNDHEEDHNPVCRHGPGCWLCPSSIGEVTMRWRRHGWEVRHRNNLNHLHKSSWGAIIISIYSNRFGEFVITGQQQVLSPKKSTTIYKRITVCGLQHSVAAQQAKEGVSSLVCLLWLHRKRLNVSRVKRLHGKRGTSDLAQPLDADPEDREVKGRHLHNLQSA